jgi:hypothetical protein
MCATVIRIPTTTDFVFGLRFSGTGVQTTDLDSLRLNSVPVSDDYHYTVTGKRSAAVLALTDGNASFPFTLGYVLQLGLCYHRLSSLCLSRPCFWDRIERGGELPRHQCFEKDQGG